jgi:hypothetical protein
MAADMEWHYTARVLAFLWRSNGCRGLFSGNEDGRDMKLTTHIQEIFKRVLKALSVAKPQTSNYF